VRLATPALVEYGSNPTRRLSMPRFALEGCRELPAPLPGFAAGATDGRLGFDSDCVSPSGSSDSNDRPVTFSLRSTCEVDAMAVRAVSAAHCHTAFPRSSCWM
jgi:hypothetical protein